MVFADSWQAFAWSLLLQVLLVSASPVQFCKTTSTFNFCLAFESFRNTSTSTNDIYLTFETTRESDTPIGWNAVGLGDEMAGSLMFIMYGDPKGNGPVISYRTASGHYQPEMIESTTGTFPDIHVLGAEYVSTTPKPQHTLSARIACYGCDQWAKRPVGEKFQPWIWATNAEQDFEGDFSTAVHLNMHATESGRGVFWADMDQSLRAEMSIMAAPVITNTNSIIGTQENDPAGVDTTPKSTMRGKMWAIHGVLMTAAFLFLYPLGIIAMRSGIPKAFKYHWVLQLAASITSGVGIAIGILVSRRYTLWHQYIGFFILFAIIVQALLGWQHHVNFIRTKRKTWMSTTHIWLGHITFMIGSINILLGLVLKHWSSLWIMGFMAIIMVEMGAVFFSRVVIHYLRRYKSLDHAMIGNSNRGGNEQDWDEYLALSDQEDDDEEGDEDNIYSTEAHGALPATGLMAGIPAKGLEDEPDDKRTWEPSTR